MNVLLIYIGDPTGTNYPLSLYLIRAYAQADPDLNRAVNFSLRILPHDVDPVSATEEIRVLAPDLVALSCYVWNIKSSLELCSELKKRSPDLTIVLGGPEVTPRAQQILDSDPSVDIVVRGEGEETFRELLLRFDSMTRSGSTDSIFDTNVLEELRLVDGISYRVGEVVHDTPHRPPFDDLGKLPVIFDDTGSDTIGTHRAVAYETFRGCPYSCSFCEWSEPGMHRRLRFVPLERIQKDLRAIMSGSVRELFFIDSALNFHPERAKIILKEVEKIQRETGCKTMVGLHLEVERIDDELCDLLVRTQARTLVGLQTFGHEALIEANRRWFKRERFESGIERLQRHGVIIYNIQIIFGLPDDNHEQFQKNVAWTLERGIRIWSGPLLLLPGTDYAMRSSELEMVADPEPPYQVISSRGYSEQEMKRSSHLSTGLDFYNRLGPGAVKEGAEILALSQVDFLEKLGSWWKESHGKSTDILPNASFPGLFAFVTNQIRKTGRLEDPSQVEIRIMRRARNDHHG
jgi:anaerobic magnesium-protoporphyrin IX monomethyl ester cyclase